MLSLYVCFAQMILRVDAVEIKFVRLLFHLDDIANWRGLGLSLYVRLLLRLLLVDIVSRRGLG